MPREPSSDDQFVSFRWNGVALDPADGTRFSVEIVENVDVSFASDTYTVDEDGSVEVELTLNADLERDATVPITVVNQDGATDQDYTAPADVTFVAGETSKSFVITPVDDSVDEDDETLKVLFGTLPENLSPGTGPRRPWSPSSTTTTRRSRSTSAGPSTTSPRAPTRR